MNKVTYFTEEGLKKLQDELNYLKTKELENREAEGLDTASSIKFGMCSSVLGCIATQPIDVVKTRMMTQAASNLTPYTNPLNW